MAAKALVTPDERLADDACADVAHRLRREDPLPVAHRRQARERVDGTVPCA